MFGCLRRILLLGLVAVAAATAWHFQGALADVWRALRTGREGGPLVASPELAEVAEAKLEALSRGGADGPVVLLEAEVQSLVQFRLAPHLPDYVVASQVDLEMGRVRARARIPVERFPALGELGEAAAFLPDTAEVVVSGQIIPLDRGRVALAVDEVTVARIPVPRRLLPAVLERLGRADKPGLPPDALAVPLPPGAAAAYVRGDSLVFLPAADRPGS